MGGDHAIDQMSVTDGPHKMAQTKWSSPDGHLAPSPPHAFPDSVSSAEAGQELAIAFEPTASVSTAAPTNIDTACSML
jgi:hypothetical protein